MNLVSRLHWKNPSNNT